MSKGYFVIAILSVLSFSCHSFFQTNLIVSTKYRHKNFRSMSLNDNSFQSTHQFDPAKMWDVKFIFNGEEKTIPVSEDSSLLESAETIFDDVPFSCRKGICANCAGKVRKIFIVFIRITFVLMILSFLLRFQKDEIMYFLRRKFLKNHTYKLDIFAVAKPTLQVPMWFWSWDRITNYFHSSALVLIVHIIANSFIIYSYWRKIYQKCFCFQKKNQNVSNRLTDSHSMDRKEKKREIIALNSIAIIMIGK